MTTILEDTLVLTDENGVNTATFEMLNYGNVLSTWLDENGRQGSEVISYKQALSEITDLLAMCWS